MAQDQAKSRSVFDFLYVDQRRIALYLAQFSEYGSLTKLIRSVEQSDENSIGTDIKIIKADNKTAQESKSEKHYDPRWIAPLNFLEELSSRNMLKPQIKGAGLGDLLLLKGSLILVDARAVEGSFKAAASVEKPLPKGKGNRHERRAVEASTPAAASNLDAFTPFKMLASLSQPVIMHFTSGGSRLWSTADPENIVGMPNDLHLKHGVSIAGEWHLVGMLDCLPGPISSTNVRFCGDGNNVFSAAMENVLIEIKKVMGRPSDCYGITPLIIMREVAP